MTRAALRAEQDRLARDHIVDAAEALFAERGWRDATMRDIAERAEYSVGALYTFFDSKDALIAAVMERHGEGILAEMHDALAVTDDPVTQLHRIVDVQIGYFRRHPTFGRLFQRSIGSAFLLLEASLDDDSFARYRQAIAVQTDVFARGVTAGVLRGGDPETLATVFSGMMQAYQARALFGPGADGHVPAFGDDELHALVDAAFVATPPNPTTPTRRRRRT